ncbi:MAG: DUF2799 domain-containing protein [Nevskiaceae bacterium]|nr:MAG: DUF2799 domain-containing protein [Nevskiaceae bacterium]
MAKDHLRLLLLLPALAAAGCATLSESECHTADWRELGRSDGAHGYEASRLGDHMEACGKYGVTPDGDAYRAGRSEGLQQYCQPDNALQLGRSGNGYNSVCPGESGAIFVAYYNRGATLHAIDGDLVDLHGYLDEERRAQDATKDLGAYKLMAQNVRYLERQSDYLNMRLDRAQQDISAGRDPEYYAAGQWKSGIPYPDARKAAEHHDEHHDDGNGHH